MASTSTALDWLRDHSAVRAHFKGLDIEKRLKESGFVRITHFLPDAVATMASAMLAKHDSWEVMHDGEVAERSDSVMHRFHFAEPEDHPSTIGILADAVALLFEGLVPSFSVASYSRGDGIGPHDDKAHLEIDPVGGGRTVLHSRKIAGILYLSKGWKAKFGGALIDLQGLAEHVPSFNSFVAFTVPRMHAVGPILTDSRPRLSMFGWWLEPGRLYELDGDETAVEYADVPEDVGHVNVPPKAAQSVWRGRRRSEGGTQQHQQRIQKQIQKKQQTSQAVQKTRRGH